MSTVTVNLRAAHHHLGDLLEEVVRGNIVVLENAVRHKPIAVLVSPKLLARLQALEHQEEVNDEA